MTTISKDGAGVYLVQLHASLDGSKVTKPFRHPFCPKDNEIARFEPALYKVVESFTPSV